MESSSERIKSKKELTPEQEAILIQAEFWKAFPNLKSNWTEKHAEIFRNFFTKNKKLFHELYGDPEKRTDLWQMIFSEVVEGSKK